MASSGWPHDMCARYLFRSPVSVSLASSPPVLIVASWSYLLTWVSTAAGLHAGSAGASKLYSLAGLGLDPSEPLGWLCGLTSLPLLVTVPHCGIGGGAGPSPLVISSPLQLFPLASVSWVVGEFPSPPRPCPYPPSTPSSLGGNSRDFVHPG